MAASLVALLVWDGAALAVTTAAAPDLRTRLRSATSGDRTAGPAGR